MSSLIAFHFVCHPMAEKTHKSNEEKGNPYEEYGDLLWGMIIRGHELC